MQPTSMDTAPTGTSTRPEFIPFAAPHLCSHIPYDNLGFHSFPLRLGWKLSGAVLTHQDHSSVSAQLAFLQSWLFFGLIIEISCISGLPLSVAAEFLVDDGKQVSTAALNGLARRWVEADKLTQGLEVKARGAEVYACYKQLHFMLVNWSSRNGKDGRRLTEPECRVLLSIGMLRRVMILTAEYYSGVPTRMDGLDIFLGWDEALGVRFNVAGEMELRQMSQRQLLHLGWCPSEVGMLEISRQRHAHFFATILERKGAMQNHDHCGDQRCWADQVSEDKYVTAHVHPECSCASISIAGENLAAVLQKGQIPRVRISSYGGMEGEFRVDVDEQTPYIAISHVWSHGLGNPYENALPKCRLLWLQGLLTAELVPGTGGGGDMALWIDTLCIPVDPSLCKYRDQAIVLLKNTYSDARAVLVLDRDLQQASRHSSTLELGIRVLCSGWMRRLWTLQEASLVSKQEPWKLNFQFLEGPLAHTELDPSLEKIYGEETYNPVRTVEEMVLLYEGLISAIRIRIPPTHDLQQESERKTRFTVIADAVAYRSTSKPRDEPVCMAGLMGLDVAAILELKTAEERMILFYMMLGEVPADIIFVRGMAKLKTAPFRWAPASILTSEFASPQYRWKPVGTCNMDGLYVAYKGFIFVDAAATNKRLETRCVIQDSETGEEYLVNKSWEGTSETFILPEQPALIFQWETHNRNTPTAVVNIETYTVNEHGQEWPANICFRVKVVHHVSISPIESVDTTGDDSLEYFAGKVTESGQIWNIT